MRDDWKIVVPTYNARRFHDAVACGALEEYGPPFVPLLIHQADGTRVVLGTHSYDERDRPDIQIERQPRGWAVFLHPVGGCDPSGYVYLLDDGRTFVQRERGASAIQVLEWIESVPEIDAPEDSRQVKEHHA